MAKYTKKQLLKYKEEIKHYYKMRKLFLGLGWACIGSAFVLFMPIAIYLGVNEIKYDLVIYLSTFSIVAGIVLLILRGPLYNQRIKNRKLAIKEAKEEQEINQMFDNQ